MTCVLPVLVAAAPATPSAITPPTREAFWVADLTMADGTVREGATACFEADGEPLTGEDAFSGAPGA